MAITVTETWSGTAYTQGLTDNQWQAIRKFQVAGVDPKNAKRDALTAVNQMGIVPGAAHPLNASQICQTVGVDDNLVCPTVTAAYAITFIALDPLATKTRWRWTPGSTQQPADFDFYGNPITDAAGSPFDPPLPAFRGTLSVLAYRNETNFNLATALQYRNTTNSAAWTTPMGTLQPGQAYCQNVYPMVDIYDGIGYVQVGYLFQLDAGELITGTSEYNSFFLRILNAGRNGWANPSGDGATLGQFVSGDNGNPIGIPVPLGAQGIPLDSSVKVWSGYGASDPVANPTPVPSNVFIDIKDIGGRSLSYLNYRRCGVNDFNALKL